MKILNRHTWCVVLLVVAAWGGFGRTNDEPKPTQPKKPTVMERKLIHAQKILAALALNDFAKMHSSATELQECAREASWQIVKSEKYARYSNDFIGELADLQKAAKAKNTEGAALAYMSMTMTCVKCHEYVREEKMGYLPDLRLSNKDLLVSR